MKIIDLPISISEPYTSPIVILDEIGAIIKYSGEEGSLIIIFDTVYGFKFTESEYIDTIDFIFGLVEIENSEWFSDFFDTWKEHGNKMEDSFCGEASHIHHYRLYIDDYGMYDILCKGFSFQVKNRTGENSIF